MVCCHKWEIDNQTAAHFENDLMILAEMWRKKIEAMNESERTRTMKGSLQFSEADVASSSVL